MKKLPYRLTVLLALIQELSEHVSDTNIHKLLFVYCHKYSCNGLYDFIFLSGVPYNFQISEDRRLLINQKILKECSNWQIASNSPRFAINLDMLDKLSLQKLKNDLAKDLITDTFIQEAYNNYFKADTDGKEALEPTLYTIGYEGMTLEAYLNKLLKYHIKCLCDVRRNPYSQKYGFSQNELKDVLSQVNIKYIHIPELGISSGLRKDLKTESDYYNLLREYAENYLPTQDKAIGYLEALLNQYNKLAITCFEASIHTCHRSKIALSMGKLNYNFKHI